MPSLYIMGSLAFSPGDAAAFLIGRLRSWHCFHKVLFLETESSYYHPISMWPASGFGGLSLITVQRKPFLEEQWQCHFRQAVRLSRSAVVLLKWDFLCTNCLFWAAYQIFILDAEHEEIFGKHFYTLPSPMHDPSLIPHGPEKELARYDQTCKELKKLPFSWTEPGPPQELTCTSLECVV